MEDKKLNLDCLEDVHSPKELNEKVLKKANNELRYKAKPNGIRTALSVATAYSLGLVTFIIMPLNGPSKLDEQIVLDNMTFQTRGSSITKAVVLEELTEQELQTIVLELAMKEKWDDVQKISKYLATKTDKKTH